MKKNNKLIWCILLIILFSSFANINVEGRGLGIGPNVITLNSAVRNATYQQTVYIYNRNDRDETIILNSTGDTKDWVKFYERHNLTTPINSTFINGKDDKGIIIQITIPSNASNQQYNGTIIASSLPKDIDETGNHSSVNLNIPLKIFIRVVGEQNIDAEVMRIDISKTEVNYPCNIAIQFKNTGNVVARPKTEITLTKDGMYVEKISAASPNIQPGNIYQQNIKWNTSGKFAGEYNAYFNITLEDKIINKTDISFDLFPAGTFKTNGTLLDLTYEGDIKVGNLVKITASFRNLGEIETTAKFFGEVYRDLELIDTIESKEITVNKYSTQNLETYYKIEQEGTHVIRGYVLFSPGKKTNTIDMTLGNKEKQGIIPIDISILPLVLAIIIAIFIAIILLKYPSIIKKIKKSRTKNKNESDKHFLSEIKKHISDKNPKNKKEKKELQTFSSKIKNIKFILPNNKK